MKKKLVLLVLALTAVLMVGCGSNDNGYRYHITVYTAVEPAMYEAGLAAFRAAHPYVNVTSLRDSTGPITTRLMAEAANPVADVVWGTAASSMLVLAERGYLVPYAPAGLDRILPMFRCSRPVPYWVGNCAWETAFIINNVVIEQLGLSPSDIRCYEDLLRPELRGQVSMPNPASSGTGMLTVAALIQMYGVDSDEGWDFIAALHENIHMYTHSGSAPARDAAAGEVAVGVSFGFPAIYQMRQGAPVTVVFPELGSGWDLEANALIRRDVISPGAQIFLDWAISDEAMEIYSRSFPIIATGQGDYYYGFEGINPADQLFADLDLEWIASNRNEIIARWSQITGE
ncbi:MAG: extracellular solute-binding protein [Defluviitaleaceae bacterium]|nr:extracellular solute-binding protein [Defluviitaleaceae bacterium]